MKNLFRLTMMSVLLGLISIAALAGTTPDVMHISCEAPNPDHQTGLHRAKGDSDVWTFSIALEGGARFVDGPHWNYPGKNGNDPDWGLWTGGDDGDSSLGWSSPKKTGSFSVSVSGQIVCGDGGDGEPIDFSAGWDGEVAYNAEIKVRRMGSGDGYSSSATVAEGGLESDEHKADVVVIATDDDGNPMEGVSVSTPTIEENFGEKKLGAVSAVGSTTTDNDGKAYFTFTSGDQRGSMTLKVDGGENEATATIDQQWANGNGSFPTGDDNDTTFTYGTPANILFKMTLDGSVPITGHDIHFKLVAISVYDWDAQGMQEYSIDVGGIPQDCLNLISIVSKQEKSPGSYPGTVTVIDDADLSITSVTIRAVDYNAYKS